MDFRLDHRVVRLQVSRSSKVTKGAELADAASRLMLLSDLATLRAASIVLASGSPRRVDMFNALLKLNARVVP